MANNRGFNWVKWLIALIIVGILIGVGYWYHKRGQDGITQYQTAPVNRGELTQVVTASGGLNPVVNVQVGSQISGIIKEIYVDYNSTVTSNQVLAKLDSSTYQANVKRADADLESAKAALELSQVEYDRSKALFGNNLVSKSDYDTAAANLHEAEANVQIKEAALNSAKVDLTRCTIYAPVDGVVISRNVDVGQTVAASFNTPTLFNIANDLTRMQIDALVSEADIGGVQVGQKVDFQVDAFPYRTFHGEISQVRYGAITNQNVVNYDCVVSVKNPDLKLLPGMTANVSIIVAQKEDALKIPNAALRFRPPEPLADEGGNSGGAAPPNVARSESGRPGGGRPGGGGGAGGGPPGGRGGGNRGGWARGGGAGAGGAAGPMSEHTQRAATHTVYVLNKTQDPKKPELVPVKIQTGINDGVNTEVISGLKEGDQVVTGIMMNAGEEDSRQNNPLSGFRRFR